MKQFLSRAWIAPTPPKSHLNLHTRIMTPYEHDGDVDGNLLELLPATTLSS
jgi:hypothetical protein